MVGAKGLGRFGGLGTEPGAAGQWHLRNTGQTGGVPGIDLNVVPVWPDYTGRGVKIGIIDDGFDLTHPDLAANFKGGWDSVDGDASPAAGPNDWHGTAVAGVLGADDNGTGLLGVAHDADLYGGRISFAQPTTAAEALQLVANLANLLRLQSGMDVSTNSYGFVVPFDDDFNVVELQPLRDALSQAAGSGRGGLGTVWVFAAGNERAFGDNVNHHNLQNSRAVITVGALDATGHYDPDSTPGAALLVSAPGTAILTTDIAGSNGYGPGDTVVETGTSLAAPMVAGVVALMLQANPNLRIWDVQEILAATARKVDAGSAGWLTNAAATWNGGGYHYSNDYGHGMVDARAAVRLAETWHVTSAPYTPSGTAARASGNTPVAIPDASQAGVTINAVLPNSIPADTVGFASLDISIQHSFIADLRISLVSPSGTESVLLDRPGLAADGSLFLADPADLHFTLTSRAFLGENPGGTWKLKVADLEADDTGAVLRWTLEVNALDSQRGFDRTYIYTDEFAALAEPSRRLLDQTLGLASINASAVTAASRIDLDGGATHIGGTALSISARTILVHAAGGDGDDTLLGNGLGNRLAGGRGNDVLQGKAGDDTLEGGGGDDTLDGGEGTDTADYATATARVVVNLALPGAQNTLGAGRDTLVGMEDLRGSRFADRLTGNAGDNRIDGAGGDDTIIGSAGHDLLVGGGGTDTLDYRFLANGIVVSSGGTVDKGALGVDQAGGFENITGTAFADHITGNTGNNVLSGLGGDDVLEGGPGIDRLDGGEGTDLASYAEAFAGVTVYLNASSSTGPGGGPAGVDYFVSIEGFIGSAYNDTLVGNAGANILQGGAGDDRLFGLDGDDSLRGGAGYDLFYGGNGSDTADYSDATVTVRAVLGTGGTVDTINFGRDWYFDIENLVGGSAKDFLTGDGGANRIEGNAGDDTIVGGAGNDTLLGGDGNDSITGGLGADLIDLGPAVGYDIIRYGAAAESRAGAMDHIMGFTQSGLGFDRIGFENDAGALFAGVAPGSIALGSRIELAAAASLAEVLAGIVGLAASSASALSVTQVKVAAGAAAGSYVVVNDTQAGYDAGTDMLIGLHFASGANLTAGNFFLF